MLLPVGLTIVARRGAFHHQANIIQSGELLNANVPSLRPSTEVNQVEFDTISLIEVIKSITNDGGVVYKHLFCAIVGFDEAITFDAAQPAHHTGFGPIAQHPVVSMLAMRHPKMPLAHKRLHYEYKLYAKC
jgi:hypothetical protein